MTNAKKNDILCKARNLTDGIFGSQVDLYMKGNQFWSDEIDMAPINTIIGRIRNYGRCGGYAMKLERVFKENQINTVGDLLRMGSLEFRKVREVGRGSITRIQDALEELYNITWW